jgi:hypothetical protein
VASADASIFAKRLGHIVESELMQEIEGRMGEQD